MFQVKFGTILIVATIIAFESSIVNTYQSYMTRIPNGNMVPNSCNSSNIWRGVGHYLSGGSGTSNSFGVSFKNEGLSWTSALCQMDSDGDGKTNGEELGDPNCVWTTGATPARTTGITHPGICEPVTSAACIAKNTQFNLQCESSVAASLIPQYLLLLVIAGVLGLHAIV